MSKSIVVDIADLQVSNDPTVTLVTYALGSCIAVIAYDPENRIGGMIHYMLPLSKSSPEKAELKPAMFADTGIPLLFRDAYKLGAKKDRLRIMVAGGAQMLDQKGLFNMGKRNYMVLKMMFQKNDVEIDFEDVGGNVTRALKLEIGTGKAWLRVSGKGMWRIWER